MRGVANRAALLILVLLSGCGSLSRLSEVGRPPELTPTRDPTREPDYRPLTMPMPAAQVAVPQANALWRNGSRAFFKDQRAAQVGDIITILVNTTDTADVKANTTASRTSAEGLGVPNLFGLEAALPKFIAGAVASNLVTANSTHSSTGTGEIKRNEAVTVRLAGVVTQVLPNGNLVVSARQEMRVNSELRELMVSGVIRPQDIASDNTVLHDRMAEARIAYGGRGSNTSVQSPRWGQQVIDILLPF